MHITDPVADMLTRIRNANNAKHDTVDVPASNMKKSIAQILLGEGYIKNFQVVEDGTQGVIHISLKYNAGKEKVITGLRRVSKPGLRVYVGADETTPLILLSLFCNRSFSICFVIKRTTNTTANCLFMSGFCLMNLPTSGRYPALIS